MSEGSDYSDQSFSDDEEEQLVQHTAVLLGYADTPVASSDKLSTEDSHIGGQPVWFNDELPPRSLVECKSCKAVMALLAQIYAPFEGTFYDRILYVFSCQKPACRRQPGSIRALRAVNRDEAKEKLLQDQELADAAAKAEEKRKADELTEAKKKELGSIGDKIFSSSTESNPFSNPFGSNPFAATSEKTDKPAHESYASVAAKKKLDSDSKTQPQPVKAEKSTTAQHSTEKIEFPALPGFFVAVEEEVLTPRKADPSLSKLGADLLHSDETGESSAGGADSAELGRMAETAANIDPVFQKFVELVDNNPEQVIRWDRALAPVLYSSHDDIVDVFASKPYKIPKCPISGGTRALELQLMPHAIMVLEEHNEDINVGMEWGTIFVATSESDAMPPLSASGVGYTEEWVGVQWEEVVA